MKRIFLILTFLAFTTHHTVNAQKVNIGEKCPNIKLTTLMNYPSREANLLTAFNNKPLIIDFWFIHCAPCVEFIPRLDSFQKAYNNQFNVLLATYDQEENIQNFFKTKRQLKNISSPIVYSINPQSDLRKMFPHFAEPHEIWIDKNGIVQAITNYKAVTPDNIEKFLRGEKLSLPEKIDPIDEFDAIASVSKSLVTVDEEINAGKGKLYYSWIGFPNPKSISRFGETSNAKKNERKIQCENSGMTVLYQVAYDPYKSRWGLQYGAIKVIRQLKDSLKFAEDYSTQKNLFNYEIFTKDTSRINIRRRMQQELDNFFQTKSQVKQENVPFYVLSKYGNKNPNRFMSPKGAIEEYVENKKKKIYIKNTKMNEIAEKQLYNHLPYEVINETGYKGNASLILPETTDLQTLKQALNDYGLDINLEIRNVNIVLITDKQN